MTIGVCPVCGRQADPAILAEHPVIPAAVTEAAGLPEPQSMHMCPDCHRDLQTWYQNKVARTAYDADARRFRSRSPIELMQEYRAAFNSFLSYKAAQRRDDSSA